MCLGGGGSGLQAHLVCANTVVGNVYDERKDARMVGSKGSPAEYERDLSYLEISGTLAKLFGCLGGLEASLAG